MKRVKEKRKNEKREKVCFFFTLSIFCTIRAWPLDTHDDWLRHQSSLHCLQLAHLNRNHPYLLGCRLCLKDLKRFLKDSFTCCLGRKQERERESERETVRQKETRYLTLLSLSFYPIYWCFIRSLISFSPLLSLSLSLFLSLSLSLFCPPGPFDR